MNNDAHRVGEAGRLVGVSGRLQIALDDPQRALRVEQGGIDLFLERVPVAGQQAREVRRRHVLRMMAGETAFALPLTASFDDCRYQFAVVALPDTRLQVLDYQSVLEAGDRPEIETLAAQLDKWLGTLATTVATPELPAHNRRLAAGPDVELPAGTAVTTDDRPLWLEVAQGGFVWPWQDGGTNEAPVEQSRLAWPVCEGLWLRVATATKASVLTSPQLLSDRQAAPVIAAFGAAFGTRLQDEMDEDLRREAAVQAARRGNQARTARLGARQLRNVLETDQADDGVGSQLPLVATCLRLARAQKMAVDEQKLLPRLEGGRQRLARITDLLQMRSREMVLPAGWWKLDLGPFLGIFGDEKRIVAMLPTGRGRYELVDGETGDRQKVTAEVADQVAGSGIYLYPSVRDERPGIGALLVFAGAGAGKDVFRIAWIILIVGMLSMVTPIFTGLVVGVVVPEARYSQLVVLFVMLLVAGLATSGLTLVQMLSALRLEGQMDLRLQSAIWDRLMRLPVTFYRDYSVGDLANRAMGVEAIRHVVSTNLVAALVSVSTAVFSLFLMLYFNWRVGLAVTGLIVVLSFANYVIGRLVLRQQRDVLARRGQLQGLVFQFLSGLTKLRASGTEERAFAIWSQQFSEIERRALRERQLHALNTTIVSVAPFLILLVVVLFVGVITHNLLAYFQTPFTWQQIDTSEFERMFPQGSFLAFYAAVAQLAAAAGMLIMVALQLSAIVPVYERLKPILEHPQESQGAAADAGVLSGQIEFKGVDFRYRPDGPLILHNVSMSIERGQFVAIVGPSGAGKSSVMRLLLGFEKPEAGSVFVDGKDLSQLDIRSVRRNFGVVLQNATILSGSIFQNIATGAKVSMDEAWEAARQAGLAGDIRAMPMQMQTVVNEGATTLSGGQRQRLLIARALVRKPRILIFDEATSALDNETQAQVSESLNRMNCTRLVIAHRLSTIRDADRIFVLTAGRVVEQGSYDELMAKDGTFAALAKRQLT